MTVKPRPVSPFDDFADYPLSCPLRKSDTNIIIVTIVIISIITSSRSSIIIIISSSSETKTYYVFN